MSSLLTACTAIPNFIIGLMTWMALITPGVHSSSRILDLLLNIPRLVAFLLMADLVRIAWVHRRKLNAQTSWFFGLLISIAALFGAMWIIYPMSRQYAVMVWTCLGPLFLLPAVANPKAATWRIAVISGVFAFHTVFGIEGLVELARPRCAGLEQAFGKYELLKPSRPPWPYLAQQKTLPDSQLFEINDIDCADPSLGSGGSR